MSGANGLQEQEDRRRVFAAVTPAGQACTLIVVRYGLGRTGQVWLSFHGANKTTAVLHLRGAADLAAAIEEAAC